MSMAMVSRDSKNLSIWYWGTVHICHDIIAVLKNYCPIHEIRTIIIIENRSERKGFTMIRYVKVDDELLAKAKEFTGIESTPELIQDSIRTLILRKEASRRLAERMKNGPRPSIEEYLKSIEKYNNDAS